MPRVIASELDQAGSCIDFDSYTDFEEDNYYNIAVVDTLNKLSYYFKTINLRLYGAGSATIIPGWTEGTDWGWFG